MTPPSSSSIGSSAATAPSAARSPCPPRSRPSRSRPRSTTACSRSWCPRWRRPSPSASRCAPAGRRSLRQAVRQALRPPRPVEASGGVAGPATPPLLSKGAATIPARAPTAPATSVSAPTERPPPVRDATNLTKETTREVLDATLPVVPIGPGHHHLRSLPDRHLHQLQRALDPRRPPAAGDQPGPRTLADGPRTLADGPGPLPASNPTSTPTRAHRPAASWRLAMVIHYPYPPARLRSNSDQPTAITNVLVATSESSYTGDIPLGTPTCSARTRRGRWALYPNGDQVVVVWPGGALAGSPVEVAGELDRLGD